MGLGQDALARRSLAPPRPDLPNPPRLALVRRPVRSHRPVTILKVPRFWSWFQPGRISSKAGDPLMATKLPPAIGLEAFGSEASPIRPVAAAPAAATASEAGKWIPVAAKWLAVIVLSAGIAVAAMFGYQRRMARAASTGSV